MFFKSLRFKLMVAYGLLATFAILCIYGVVYLLLFLGGSILFNIQRLNMVERAIITYLEDGNELNDFSQFFVQEVIEGPIASIPPPSSEGEQEPSADPPPRSNAATSFGVLDPEQRVVLPISGLRPNNSLPDDFDGTIHPVIMQDEVVAYIVTRARFDWVIGRQGLESSVIQGALRVLNRGLPLTIIFALIPAIGIGLVWATLLISPLNRLGKTARQLAAGRLGITQPVKSQDEIGRLILAFNQMSKSLATASATKKRLTQGIAMALNKPMSATFQSVAAIRSGESQMTADQLRNIVQELNQMDRLIEDLNLLSKVDTNRLKLNIQTIDTRPFLEELIAEYLSGSKNQEISVDFESPDQALQLRADQGYLERALKNVFDSAFAQAGSDSQIHLTAGLTSDGFVTLLLSQLGRRNSEEQAPALTAENGTKFNRDPQSNTTMTGLGVMICAELIEAMGGIVQRPSQMGGRGDLITIALPTG